MVCWDDTMLIASNTSPTAEMIPAAEDEVAATQQSLLEELHTISEEVLPSQIDRCSVRADDAEPRAPASQVVAMKAEALAASVEDGNSTSRSARHSPSIPDQDISVSQLLGHVSETSESRSQQDEVADPVVAAEPGLPSIESQAVADVPTPEETKLPFDAELGPPLVEPADLAHDSKEAVAPQSHDPIIADVATPDVSTEALFDHDNLFDGIDEDAFGEIELSPPVRRNISLPALVGPSQPRRDPAPPSPTRACGREASQILADQGFGGGDDDDFHSEPPVEVGQTTSFLGASFAGFKTGHGKIVKPSEKALASARKFLLDLEETTDLIPTQRPSSSQLSQPTASRAPPAATSVLAGRSPMREVPTRQNVPTDESGSLATLKSAAVLPAARANDALLSRQSERQAVATPKSIRSGHLFSSQAPSSPVRVPASASLARFTTPQPSKKISLGMLPRMDIGGSTSRKRTLPRFVTPFKNGKRPKAEELADASSPLRKLDYGKVGASTSVSVPLTYGRATHTAQSVDADSVAVFRLQSDGPRQKLADVGRPEQFSSMQMIARGVPDEILVILNDASRASQYAFEGPAGTLLQQQDALDELVARGCSGAKLAWVQNHWTLILWKLAAMVRLDPACAHARWSWHELVRQLLYRYEREVHRAQRSCVKRIQEHDSAPSRPMVLVVSKILEEETEVQDRSGQVVVRKETLLELSDGWYRIQAQVDATLARACQRGRLRVGHKLAITGATLDAQGEGNEVLAAYHLSSLVLSANSTSLARWDARLGFAARPMFASLRSLTADGGVVALMDVIITKVFPLAYVDAERSDRPGAPRGEQEEAEQQEDWRRRREDALAQLELQRETEQRRLYDLVEALGELAGDTFLPSVPDDPTGRWEGMAATLFEQLRARPNAAQAVKELVVAAGHVGLVPWLHSMAKAALLAEDAGARVGSQLDRLCPPRKVRGFRVVRFRDARLAAPPVQPAQSAYVAAGGAKKRNPHARTVQLTVWDAAQLADELQEGRRFCITNLVPTSKTAWRKPDEPADVFLSTRRDTRWRLIA